MVQEMRYIGYWVLFRNQGSSVSIVSDYRLDNRGLISSKAKGFFL
jgi:hypothetical protein